MNNSHTQHHLVPGFTYIISVSDGTAPKQIERSQTQLDSFKDLQAQKQQWCCQKTIPATDTSYHGSTQQHAQEVHHL